MKRFFLLFNSKALRTVFHFHLLRCWLFNCRTVIWKGLACRCMTIHNFMLCICSLIDWYHVFISLSPYCCIFISWEALKKRGWNESVSLLCFSISSTYNSISLPYRVTVPCTPCSYCQGRSLRRRLNHCLLQCLLNYMFSAVSSVLVVQDEAIYLEIIDFCWVLIFLDFMY